MQAFLIALAVSFAAIFVAELGDKSQLMALTFATRYPAATVLTGITVATAAVHLISVAIGHGLGTALPTPWITLAAGLAFLGFGAWTLRGDTLNDDAKAKAARRGRSATWTIAGAFLLAELGDKTMLATITLATQYGWIGTWIGSTAGMIAADALAILAGRYLRRILSEKIIRYTAAALFAIFGIWLLTDTIPHLTP